MLSLGIPQEHCAAFTIQVFSRLCFFLELSYSSKLEELAVLLKELVGEEGRKIVLFSEWTAMLDLIEPKGEGGSLQLTVSFPDESILDTPASVLERIASRAGS